MCLTAITATEIQAHIQKLLSRVQMRILVVGNMFKEVRAEQNDHRFSSHL